MGAVSCEWSNSDQQRRSSRSSSSTRCRVRSSRPNHGGAELPASPMLRSERPAASRPRPVQVARAMLLLNAPVVDDQAHDFACCQRTRSKRVMTQSNQANSTTMLDARKLHRKSAIEMAGQIPHDPNSRAHAHSSQPHTYHTEGEASPLSCGYG